MSKDVNSDSTKKKYKTPETKKYNPLEIVKGTGGDSGVSLYTECSLYYYY